jgi:hypothetical protein
LLEHPGTQLHGDWRGADFDQSLAIQESASSPNTAEGAQSPRWNLCVFFVCLNVLAFVFLMHWFLVILFYFFNSGPHACLLGKHSTTSAMPPALFCFRFFFFFRLSFCLGQVWIWIFLPICHLPWRWEDRHTPPCLTCSVELGSS